MRDFAYTLHGLIWGGLRRSGALGAGEGRFAAQASVTQARDRSGMEDPWAPDNSGKPAQRVTSSEASAEGPENRAVIEFV